MKEQNLHGYFLRVFYIKRNINNSAARSHHLHDLMQDAPKFSWARTSLSSKWQGELSIALLIRTANTRSPCWLMKLATRALTATLKPPTSFKQTGTLWSCNAEHIEVQLCGLVCKTQTWQGTRQTWSSFLHCLVVAERPPSSCTRGRAARCHQQAPCLELDVALLEERVKFPFTLHRNSDRCKWVGGVISDRLSEQSVSFWVGFTANVLQVTQAPPQPLAVSGCCLPPSSCFGQTEDKNEENKTKYIPATHQREGKLEKNC